MIHAKFQDNRTPGFGEDIFKGFYHIRAWLPSWSCDLNHLCQISFSLLPKRLLMKFGIDWPSGFREEDV